jgi:hypothetical protein
MLFLRRMGGAMIRSAVVVLLFGFLAGCYKQHDDMLVVPLDHPASPYAEPAGPITVPPIRGRVEQVVPEVGHAEPRPGPPADPGVHEHQH